MDRESWNLLVYKVPAQPSTQRVYVWRKLKGLGALYLQQSVCLLPQRKDLRSHLEELKADIIAGGGEADLLTIWIDEPQQNAMLIERFQQQADQEYQEFLGQCRDFHSELSEERRISNLTFAELEENEAELTKLRSWLPKIRDRDLFDAQGYSQATEVLKACELDFQLFTEQVYQAEGIDSESL
ncbi:MAG: Chromate resistance protein ChrB [Nostoc sp.]|uniref:Chromate resistance protein ChrB n=1 Tax=Nostoc sp. TaxID=1180 RepID=UPI002FF9976B